MPAAADSSEVRWLDDDERAAWLAIAALVVKLPGVLDAQLQADQGLSFFEYMVMAVLSEQPDRTLQMSEIASATSASLSRLSHTVKRLEAQGWIRRERIPGAGRRTNAILTAAGFRKVEAAAPEHVRRVRELVIDSLTADELALMRGIGARILEKIDPDRTWAPGGSDC